MSIRKIVLAVVAGMALGSSAQAESAAVQSRPINLGGLNGVTYYTVTPNGYRVVVTLARHDTTPAVRFETTLAAGQETILSIPQELGLTAQSLKISRTGDDVTVRQAPQETASAQ